MNGENEPIGKGNPRRLFNGDVLRMGDFEITVAISEGESIVMPIEEEQTRIARTISSSSCPKLRSNPPWKLLDEEELTGDDEFQSALFGKEVGRLDGCPEPETPARPEPVEPAAADK